MTSPCPPTHERWLEELLTAGPEALTPDARAELERCPRCAREQAELVAVQAAIASAAQDERTTVAGALREAGATEEAFARNALAAQLGRRTGKRRRAALWIAAAGVAAAVILVFQGRPGRDEPAPDVLLGDGRIRIEAPVGRADFDRFTWKDATPDGCGYRVTVLSASGEHLKRVVDAPPLLLTEEETKSWPDRILWTVEALDGALDTIQGASDSAEAWR